VLDPGLGFAKPGASNWPLLARLPELVADGFPVLVGASRKRFLGHLLARPDGEPAPPLARDHATAAVSALAAAMGAWCVRVHEVAGSADAVRVAAAWRAAGAGRTDGRPGAGLTAGRPGAGTTDAAQHAPDDHEMPVDEDATTGRSWT
jgi:dihydropteroate synthase